MKLPNQEQFEAFVERRFDLLTAVFFAFLLAVVFGPLAACRVKSPGDGDVIIQPPAIPDASDPLDPSFDAERQARDQALPLDAWAFAGPVEELAQARAAAPDPSDDGGVQSRLWIVFYDAESGLETDRQRVVELTTETGIRWPVGQLWRADSFRAGQKQRVGANGIGLMLGAER